MIKSFEIKFDLKLKLIWLKLKVCKVAILVHSFLLAKLNWFLNQFENECLQILVQDSFEHDGNHTNHT